MAPEIVFNTLCEQHDLTVVNIGLNLTQSREYLYGATVHWDGFSRDGISCASGNGPTVTAALKAAIAQSVVDRTPPHPIDIPVIDLDKELAA